MQQTDTLQDYVEDLFSPLGRIKVRPMFGAKGIYAGEDMFAILEKDRIYVKIDDEAKAELAAAGSAPFIWTNPKTGQTLTMSYMALSDAIMQDRQAVTEWAQRGLSIVIQARKSKVKSPRRRVF